jgi:rhodanese-related sulfurtransferase
VRTRALWSREFLGSLSILVALAVPSAFAGHAGAGLVPSYYSEHVKRFLDAGEPVVLLDVRRTEAFRAAHLPGARSVPLAELDRRLPEIPRSGRVVLYGDSIIDASEAYARLRDQGYRNVGVLEDGFAGWVGRGFPVEPRR